jgi:hypothetical protein
MSGVSRYNVPPQRRKVKSPDTLGPLGQRYVVMLTARTEQLDIDGRSLAENLGRGREPVTEEKLTEETHQPAPLAISESTGHFLSNILVNRLNTYFPEAARDDYTDDEISEIYTLLKQFNPRWSKVTRTYIVLRTIGSLVLLDRCIDIGFFDYWFPVTERSLPDILRSSVKTAFVGAQHRIVADSMNLENGERERIATLAKGLIFRLSQREF